MLSMEAIKVSGEGSVCVWRWGGCMCVETGPMCLGLY
jgi:hypothetical protein